MDHVIWWTSQEDCEQLGDDPAWPEQTPTYIREEYRSRWGRAGRGRLWCAKDMPQTISGDWPTHLPTGLAAHECGGIVIHSADAITIAALPGFLTTLDMRWANLQC